MIVYLHGLNSSPLSGKATQLGEYMAALGRLDEYRCPELPYTPSAAIARIESELADCDARAITLVGSSLGGFYATHLAEKHGWKAVLVNPAVHVHTLLPAVVGPQTNWYTGEEWQLTETHLEQLAALDVARITHPERYFLLVQTGDELLDYRDAVVYYAGARQIIEAGGDHGFTEFERHFPALLAFSETAP